jgi:hypothetical protein
MRSSSELCSRAIRRQGPKSNWGMLELAYASAPEPAPSPPHPLARPIRTAESRDRRRRRVRECHRSVGVQRLASSPLSPSTSRAAPACHAEKNRLIARGRPALVESSPRPVSRRSTTRTRQSERRSLRRDRRRPAHWCARYRLGPPASALTLSDVTAIKISDVAGLTAAGSTRQRSHRSSHAPRSSRLVSGFFPRRSAPGQHLHHPPAYPGRAQTTVLAEPHLRRLLA